MKAPTPVAQANKSLDMLVRNELPPSQLLEDDRAIDANRLASWLDNGMTLGERQIFGFEAALSTRTRRLLCKLKDHEPVAPAELKYAHDTSGAWWLLLLLPIAAIAAWLLHGPVEDGAAPIEHRLYRKAEALGFRAIPLRELLKAPPPLVDAKHGSDPSVHAVWPQGHVLDRRRLSFEWVPADVEGQITVRHVSGTITCQLQGQAPLHVPRRYEKHFNDGETYIWELTPTDGSDAAIPRSFTLARDAEREHFEEFQAKIEADRLGQLLTAHYALSLDHLQAAAVAAKRWVDLHPKSAIGLATLWQTLRRVDSPEAKFVRTRLEEQYRSLRKSDGSGASEAEAQKMSPTTDR